VKLLLLLLVLVVVGLVVAVAAGSITGGLGDPARSTPDPGLPPGTLTAQDLERVRFAPALRGYRMDQVDALLDRLREQLAVAEEQARRARLARLVTDPGDPAHAVHAVHPGPSGHPTHPGHLVAGPDDDAEPDRPVPHGSVQDPAAGPVVG
jgi:DivIVA domain-containing protein